MSRRRIRRAAAVAVGVAFVLVWLSDRRWLADALDAVADGRRQSFWLGFACALGWVGFGLAAALVLRVVGRPGPVARWPGLAVFAGLGALAILTAPSGHDGTAWSMRVNAVLPGFFDGWLAGAAVFLAFGAVVWVAERVGTRRIRGRR